MNFCIIQTPLIVTSIEYCYNIHYLIKLISLSAPRLREIKTEATEDELWTFHCVFIFFYTLDAKTIFSQL